MTEYNIVLEIGCGVGYSTLALLKEGHKVIAVDKNIECVYEAKKRIQQAGFSIGNDLVSDVMFIVADLVDANFYEKYITRLDFDVVICWNIGTYYDGEVKKQYQPFILEYGLTEDQIVQNWESSYAEFILWKTCMLASKKDVPCHIIDRSMEGLTSYNNDYYSSLGGEFKYKRIMVNNLRATSISLGGRALISNGKPIKEGMVFTVLISVLYLK